jgi:hypothetical protein
MNDLAVVAQGFYKTYSEFGMQVSLLASADGLAPSTGSSYSILFCAPGSIEAITSLDDLPNFNPALIEQIMDEEAHEWLKEESEKQDKYFDQSGR